MEALQDQIISLGPFAYWIALFIVVGLFVTVGQGFLKARKIQPNTFQWAIFRHEVFWSTTNLVVSAFVLGGLTTYLKSNGWITFDQSPAEWWVILLEYALYFFAFDAYFYWGHRIMHIPGIYELIHKTHHRSMSPTLLTTVSVNPLESLVNGGFVPLFTAMFVVHQETFALIAPTNIIMGVYVHNGYEFLPRWWNKTWITKWFITTTFHDQHHRYFRGNYGGYTTLWDYAMGTVRPNYESGFEAVKKRSSATKSSVKTV